MSSHLGISFLFAASLVALSVGITANAQTAKQSTQPKIFRFSQSVEPGSLDPGYWQDIRALPLLNSFFEGLTRLDAKTLEPLPAVAERWTSSIDGRVYTFYIRDKIYWSDGSPLTAHDVVFGIKRNLQLPDASPFREILCDLIEGAAAYCAANIEQDRKPGIRALGERVLTIRLTRREKQFPSLVSLPIFAPVSRKAVKKYGIAWADPSNIVGNGPYQLKEWRAQDRMLLSANPRYRGVKSVGITEIEVVFTNDPKVALGLYHSGRLDWTGDVRLPQDQLAKLRTRGDFHSHHWIEMEFFLFNSLRLPFSNTGVRKALSYGSDRSQMAAFVRKSGESAANYFFPPLFKRFLPRTFVAPNLRAARGLLLEAGYCAKRMTRKGCKPFPLLRISCPKTTDCKKTALALRNYWLKELGIEKVRIEEYDQVALPPSSDWDLAFWQMRPLYQGPEAFLRGWLSSQLPPVFDWRSYAARLRQADKVSEPRLRSKELRRAEGVLLERMPALPLLVGRRSYLLKEHVGGFHENLMDLHPLQSIYFKKD